MPTTITETIGSGGDFTTPALWEAALPANLVTADEIRVGEQLNEEFSGSGNQLTIAGQTTDATRYVVYTAAAGASFADNANKLTNELRYNASNGAGIRGTSYYSTAAVVTTDYTRITRLQIHASGGPGVVGLNITNGIVDQCIVQSTALVLVSGGSLGNSVVSNCLVILNSSRNEEGILLAGGSATVLNCSIVRPSNFSPANNVRNVAIRASYLNATIKNVAGFNFWHFANTVGGSLAGNNNASDTTISFGTSNQASLTYADQFEQASNASSVMDFRLKSGHDLGAGTDLSGSGVTVDIVGTARSGTYDIGCWQFSNPNVNVTLTGIAATASAGSVSYALGASASGSGATGSAGSVGPAIGMSASGSAAAAAAGTPTSAIGLAVTGAAMTVSAGALAYTIGFILTGAAAASASGTLAADPGNVSRSLTGIQMSAVPGNVRVTGGTRWVPQEARAVTLPTAVGNTLPPPPRLTGDAQADIRAQGQWLATLYDQMVKVNNVFGRINDHETRIAALEASNDNGN